MPYHPRILVLGHFFVPGERKLLLLILRAGFLAPGTIELYFFCLPDPLWGVLGYQPKGQEDVDFWFHGGYFESFL